MDREEKDQIKQHLDALREERLRVAAAWFQKISELGPPPNCSIHAHMFLKYDDGNHLVVKMDIIHTDDPDFKETIKDLKKEYGVEE